MQKKMIISDLDGTLLNKQKQIGTDDLKTLEKAKQNQIVRVMATGRHLFSITRTFGENPPFDYAVLSCGIGIYSFIEKKLLKALCFSETETSEIITTLEKNSIDFMAHAPLPENHFFNYRLFNQMTPAFQRRLEVYPKQASVFSKNNPGFQKISQVVIICEADSFKEKQELIQSVFAKHTIIHSASPFLDGSIWLEILPSKASKSKGSEALCRLLGIHRSQVMALGNDYNDKDLLEWSPYSYVVDNAPEDLKQKHSLVGSHDQNPLTQAFNHWLAQKEIS